MAWLPSRGHVGRALRVLYVIGGEWRRGVDHLIAIDCVTAPPTNSTAPHIVVAKWKEKESRIQSHTPPSHYNPITAYFQDTNYLATAAASAPECQLHWNALKF